MSGPDPDPPADGSSSTNPDDRRGSPPSDQSPSPPSDQSSSPPSDQSPSPQERLAGAVPTWFRDRTRAVVAVTLVALLARLVALGARPAHWDEARVAYWADYARDGGSFAYRSIVHGPFIQHVDRWLFELVGTTDFVMRFPVAIVGSLLPLSALLFRNQLRDEETVGLALLLSFNPVLLYYSRFMRSDVLVAAFMFTALGMLVRLAESRRPRYVYGAALFVALGVASKENAVVYLLTWFGAGALVLDRALDSPGSDLTGGQRLVGWLSTARDRLRAATEPPGRRRTAVYALHVIGALLLFGAVWLFMFAPRGDGLQGLYTSQTAEGSVGLWDAAGDPGKWPALVDATVSQFADQYLGWGDKSGDLSFDAYQERLEEAVVDGLLTTSIATTLLGVTGFVRERYGVAEGRALIFFLFYAAAASVVGYPIGLSIGGGWKWGNVHILVPLAVPAAVGLGTVYRWGKDAFADDDPIDVGLTALILLMIVSTVAWSGLSHVYLNPQHESNTLVQFGQPHDDLQPVVENLQAAAPGEGTDVLIYDNTSSRNSMVGSSPNGWNVRPTCTDLELFLPMHWYLASTNATGECASSLADLREQADPDRVPIVLTRKRTSPAPTVLTEEGYTHVGNFSLRYTADSTPTLSVYVSDELAE